MTTATHGGQGKLRRNTGHGDEEACDFGSPERTTSTRVRRAKPTWLKLNALAAALTVATCIACGETGSQATTNVQGGAARAPGGAPQQAK